jgi:hypothetical protein
MFVNLATNGSYSGLSFEYYANTWKKLALIDSYAFDTSKYLRWVLPSDWFSYNFTDTSPQDNTPPDTLERFWIKITCTSVATTAVISYIRALAYATYTTAEEVRDAIQLDKNTYFDNSSYPTLNTIEDYIARIESRMDYKTKKSWKFNVISEEAQSRLVDYNRYGVYLRNANFIKVYSVEIWNGSSWSPLIEGRNQDYFINYDLGVIYFTRLFLLPAAYGLSGRYFNWGFGEYKNSVRINYAYGRNKEIDPEFRAANRIATKFAMADVLINSDYSVMAVSGVDKVEITQKVSMILQEAENELEELSGISIY